jgi:hypothetical protein
MNIRPEADEVTNHLPDDLANGATHTQTCDHVSWDILQCARGSCWQIPTGLPWCANNPRAFIEIPEVTLELGLRCSRVSIWV